jgi:hypothetical protein
MQISAGRDEREGGRGGGGGVLQNFLNRFIVYWF